MDSGASPLQGGGEPPEAAYQPTRFQRTLLLLHERLQDFDAPRAGDRLASAVLRGAASGLALRGGLHAASYAFGLLLRRRRAAAPGARPGWAALLEDTMRYAAFLGGFAGVFVAADEIIALLGGKKRTSAWRALVSGALAGPTMLLTGSAETHTSLSLYVLLRGLALLVRCGNLPAAAPWKRRLLAPTRWRHGDVALMCLSTAQIGYSWIILPQTLPPSYIRFLNRHGGKSLAAYDALREASARPAGAAPAALASLRGTRHAHYSGARPCGFLHPGRSCAGHVARFLPAGYLRAVPVYFPVYLIPAILVHRSRLVQRRTAAELWPKIAAGIARSSLFLALYCTLAWGGACTGFNVAGRSSGRVVALSCWTGGLAAVVEKKSRRMELAFYCMSRALESFALCLVAWGVVPKGVVPRRIDVLLFSAATAAICHCYSDHMGARRDVFRSKYLTVFDFVLGNTGFKSASIRHHPSNLQLLLALGENMEGSRAMAVPLHLVRSMAALSGYAANGRDTPTLALTPARSVPLLRDAEDSSPAGSDSEEGSPAGAAGTAAGR